MNDFWIACMSTGVAAFVVATGYQVAKAYLWMRAEQRLAEVVERKRHYDKLIDGYVEGRKRQQEPNPVLNFNRDLTAEEVEQIRRRFQLAQKAGFSSHLITTMDQGMRVAQQASWLDAEAHAEVFVGDSAVPLRKFREDGSEVRPDPTPEELRRQGEDLHGNIIDLGVQAAAEHAKHEEGEGR